jgi:hypothetical protein
MFRRQVQIGQIAASVSGGQQLAAHPVLALQEQNTVSLSGCGQCGHQTRGTAADHCYRHIPHLLSLVIFSSIAYFGAEINQIARRQKVW